MRASNSSGPVALGSCLTAAPRSVNTDLFSVSIRQGFSGRYSPRMSVAAQAELITDDPRCDGSFAEDLRELKRFWDLSREHGGLLTCSQAAKILDVTSSHVSAWRHQGRLSSFEVLGTRMLPAGEVMGLRRERDQGIRHAGGRGLKAPSLVELAKAALKDAKE